MKIMVSLGHSLLKNGLYTSADGYCNEYKYNKKLINDVVKCLRKKGHDVDMVKCPEKTFECAFDERHYKLAKEHSKKYDLVMELHLNSGVKSANGAEVLYLSDSGKKYAERVQKGLSSIFTNRGIKKRDDLYMLTKTKAPSIIVESFFCTSKSDYKKGKGVVNRRKVAKAITKYL